MAKAVYCKCKNTYSIECKNNKDKKCNAPEYWSQGIGRINALPVINEVFGQTFDNTFK
jgi:hypothetical protein